MRPTIRVESLRVLAIVDEQEVTMVTLDTGEVLPTHLIEPVGVGPYHPIPACRSGVRWP